MAQSLSTRNPYFPEPFTGPTGVADTALLNLCRQVFEKRKWEIKWIVTYDHGDPIWPLESNPDTVAILVETFTANDGVTVVDPIRDRTTQEGSSLRLGFEVNKVALFPWNKAFYYCARGRPRIGYVEIHDPAPTYQAETEDSPLLIDTEFYDRLAAVPLSKRTLTESLTIPIREAKAWMVPKGSLCRLVAPEGSQVGDLNIWNAHDRRERFWAARTRQLHGTHVSTHARLWSNLPFMRPLVTITADTLGNYGVDADGGRVHDLLGTRCDPYIRRTLAGDDFDHHCHSNLVRAVTPLGLDEFDVHDVINVFQVTGLNKDGRYFMKTSPAKPGEYFEFFAEIDVLCAMSACPGGDLSIFSWSDDEAMLKTCHPLQVEVYDLKEKAHLLDGWSPPEPSAYKGKHGLRDA